MAECIRMLHGSTEAVRIEAPGIEKAEFVVTVGSRRELHQVKRSHPGGKWTLRHSAPTTKCHAAIARRAVRIDIDDPLA